MSVHWSGECGVYIGGCADEEEDHHEEGVEVEEGGLEVIVSILWRC